MLYASTNDGRKRSGVIARLLDCAEQAADAVFACTQEKMDDAPNLRPNSKVRVS